MTDITRTLDFNHLSSKHFKMIQGEYNSHLKLIGERLGVQIHQRQSTFILSGNLKAVDSAEQVFEKLADNALDDLDITPEELHLIIQTSLHDTPMTDNDNYNSNTDSSDYTPISLKTRKATIIPRGGSQQHYVKQILNSDVSFGVGPAGTGKTYLAVACAVDMLERNEIERILLVRPAVEAGEKLGFLPGDLTQKIDPYLRPLYDALYEMLGSERVEKLLERNVIEIAPLAYMRGRTLNNSFVILDEAQNTTPEQMKMFLTRLGFGSRAVITGDITQVDLPRGNKSGLTQALRILSNIKEIHVTKFTAKDVVRHQLVQKIIEAYDVFDAEQEKHREQRRKEKEQERANKMD